MTTDKARLTALVERCEAATGPDRGIDMAICIALNTGRKTDPRDPGPDRFTGSIDAAVMLLPKGKAWDLTCHGEATVYVPNVSGDGSDFQQWSTVAATPALALCAASLRALASKEPTT